MEGGDGEPFGLERETRGRVASITAEFVGTIVVTLATLGPAAVARSLGMHLGYAVETGTTGIGTMVVIYSLRYVSGAHTNPCTTIAFALFGDFDWKRVPGYVAAQFLGAFCAGELVLGILHPARNALLPEMALGGVRQLVGLPDRAAAGNAGRRRDRCDYVAQTALDGA
jgi:glycerol uptake facilitator-like aquaporin